MFAQTSRTGAALLAALLISLGAQAAPAEPARVPDLLSLPAQVDGRALHSMQLAVSRAGERLVSVGERGVVLLSDDNGRQWRQARQVPVSVALTDVSFVSAQDGWAVGHGGVVLHSSDGGEQWTLQLDGNQAARAVLEAARARVAEGDTSAERAVRSATRLVEEGPDKPFLAVRFRDAREGWVVGAYGLAFHTADGGKSWAPVGYRLPNPGGKHLYRVALAGDTVVVAGEQGALFRSDDAGARFGKVETPYEGSFFGALLMEPAVLAFGLRGNAWRSEDGVGDWQQVELGQPVSVTAGLRLQDGRVALADESGRVLLSRDGAQHFDVLPMPAASGLTGLAEAADGALILSTARGPLRINPNTSLAEASK